MCVCTISSLFNNVVLTLQHPFCFHPYRLKIQPNPILGNTPPTPKKQSGVFANGDRVKLRQTALDTYGCPGDPGSGLVGTIDSSNRIGAPTVLVSGSTHYRITDLMHEFEDMSSISYLITAGQAVSVVANSRFTFPLRLRLANHFYKFSL